MRLLEAQREKTLPSYEGPQGLAQLRLLMIQQEHRGLNQVGIEPKIQRFTLLYDAAGAQGPEQIEV
jgi:hypothetical protein